MVVRALKALGRPNTRVNERHDIVMDVTSETEPATYKISGSAYKLTRLRSLHHGTCLLRSPNLSSISGLLRSPALGYLDARGVDSVRTPVKNVDVGNDEFKDAVVSEFESMYGDVHFRGEFDDTALQVEEIRRGYHELQSKSWIWGQTPRFTFSTHPTEEDPRPRPELPFDVSIYSYNTSSFMLHCFHWLTFSFKLNMSLLARHGIIDEVNIKHSDGAAVDALDASIFQGVSIWEIGNWAESLNQAGLGGGLSKEAGAWLNGIFGTEYTNM